MDKVGKKEQNEIDHQRHSDELNANDPVTEIKINSDNKDNEWR